MKCDIFSDSIEFNVITSIYKDKVIHKKVDGVRTPVKSSILVKELRLKKWIQKKYVTSVDEYLTTKNTIAKNRAIIYDSNANKFFAVNHPMKDIVNRLNPVAHNKIGFK